MKTSLFFPVYRGISDLRKLPSAWNPRLSLWAIRDASQRLRASSTREESVKGKVISTQKHFYASRQRGLRCLRREVRTRDSAPGWPRVWKATRKRWSFPRELKLAVWLLHLGWMPYLTAPS